MEKGYKILGNYIRLVDERNKNLAVTKLLGVSISKKFIPSIANIVGTDLSNYKIVRTGQFAYGPVTSRNGEKISIAYLDEEDCIISSSYTVFEVENKEELDPEYLMLWFSRPEFDRYARYKSHGSVREIFDWNELCMVELPVPDIEKQRKIVKAYKTITDRIDLKQKINDNNSINQSYKSINKIDVMDETAVYMTLIRENIDYDIMMQDYEWKHRDMYEELYQIICDVVCVPRQEVRIAGEDYPYSLVKSKFLKLKKSHLEYVIGCMERNTTKIVNIKAYLITALYNAPNTISHYYSAEVNHDMCGVRLGNCTGNQ